MTIFVNGRQKRVRRPQLIDGIPVDEFIARNADALWLHQNEMWELIPQDVDAETTEEFIITNEGPSLPPSSHSFEKGNCRMPTFISNIKFSQQGIKDIGHITKRAAIFKAEAKKMGVKVKDIYWTLGEHDGLLILEAADDETATAAILRLGAMGNVHTTTCRAFTAAEMDKIVAKVHGG